MKVELWMVAACGLSLLPVAGVGQTPRYQSPYTNTPSLTGPKLPTPAAITANGSVVEDVVARVNDQIISRSDVERSEQQLQQELQQQNLPAAERSQREKDMLRDMVDQQLLLSKAKELGLNADAEVIRRLDELRKQNNLPDLDALAKAAQQQGLNFEDFKANIRNQILTQQVVRDEVGRHLQMTQGQEQAFFDAHKQEFEQPEQVRASEILIPLAADASEAQVAQAQKKADEVVAKLKAGDKFEDLAKQYSGGQTAANGGDLGTYKRGGMAKVIEDQLYPLKVGESTAPIRTKQGFVILKLTEHQAGGVPTLKQVEPQVQEAMYMQAMAPALRTYLTKLREDAYVDIKPGFVDSGASPRQTRFVDTAYAAPQSKKQKRKAKQKARLERARGGAAPAAAPSGLAALPAGTGPAAIAPAVSGAAPAPGTTAVVAAAAAKGAEDTPVRATAADLSSGKTRAAQRVSTRGKGKKVRREKIRYGQAPRNSLPSGTTEIATGTDVGTAAQSAAVTPGGVMEQGRDVAPGVAMAPTESTTEVSSTADGDVNPLEARPATSGKVRFASRDKEYRAQKTAQKQVKVNEKVAATPDGPSVTEAASQKVQAAPLGLNGDTAKKKKKQKVKGAAKERLQDKKPEAGPAPIDPTVNPNLGATPGGAAAPANAAPDSNEKNTTLPSSTAAPGAPPQGQPLPPDGTPQTTPNGTAAPQPQM